MELSIIIPCYNEEDRIGSTLERIASYLSMQSYESEVIVVDNGSTDDSGRVVMEYANKIKNLQFISKRSHGKGWAIKEGMLDAKGNYRLFMDADNSTDIWQVDKLLKEVRNGCDVAISSRRIEGAIIKNPQPAIRRFVGNTFVKIVRAIIPLGIEDTQNGFKLFTGNAAELIFPHQTIFYWAFDVEILAIAQRFNLCIKEVPIEWIDSEGSKMTLKGMSRMFLEIVLTRIILSTSKYIKNERREDVRRKIELSPEELSQLDTERRSSTDQRA